MRVALAAVTPFAAARIPGRLFLVPRRGGVGDALYTPSSGVVSSNMINWAAGPVTVPSAASYVGQMIQSLENDVRFKLQTGGVVLEPGACRDKFRGELLSYCSIYTDACNGVNVDAMLNEMCGHYEDYLASQVASVGAPVNYVAPQIAYPIYTEGGPIKYYEPTGTKPPQSVPTSQIQTMVAPAPVQTSTPPPAAQTTVAPATTKTDAAEQSLSDQVSSLFDGDNKMLIFLAIGAAALFFIGGRK
jgi:hypothetical protein